MVVWRVPDPVPPSEHPFKYRLAFVHDGKRAVGYDNERGKGDHRHYGEKVEPYQFKDLRTLTKDFYKDIEKYKEKKL